MAKAGRAGPGGGPARGRKPQRPQLDLFGAALPAAPAAAPGEAVPAPPPASSPAPEAPVPAPAAAVPARRATAESMAQKQREISVSEFFVKNRHLLGFDNPQKALLTAVRECVDNSLDACGEAGILPTLRITIVQLAEIGRAHV